MFGRLLLLIAISILFISCSEPEKRLTAADMENEKEQIKKVIREYNKSVEDKNFAAMVETLAGEVVFFGTDSSEVIKTFPAYKEKMMEQWELFDKTKYGEMHDVDIQIDEKATIASIIFGIPYRITIGNGTADLYLRMQRTLKKEHGKWVIVSGIVGNVSNEQGEKLKKLLESKKVGPNPTN